MTVSLVAAGFSRLKPAATEDFDEGAEVTEADWLTCCDPLPMLDFLRARVSDRKLRLFACACCRKVWHTLNDGSRRAVEVAEQFADGKVGQRERTVAKTAALEATDGEAAASGATAAYWAASSRLSESVAEACLAAADAGASAAASHISARSSAGAAAEHAAAFNQAHLAVAADQAVLLHHLAGNPFIPAERSGDWSQPVTQLADALYAGAECAFALHDALLEAGHPELADHFRERAHPKGCWALDAILGRE